MLLGDDSEKADFSVQGLRCEYLSNPLGIDVQKPRLALAKDFQLGKESRVLQLKVETFNTLNHFNPGNPNTSLNLNFATGANTNAAFGTITGTQGVDSRRVILSARFRF